MGRFESLAVPEIWASGHRTGKNRRGNAPATTTEATMKHTTTATALAMATLLGACASNTVAELKADAASYDGTTTSATPYAVTYRALRDAARQCMEHNLLGYPVTVDSESDGATGQLRQRNMATTTTVIEVEATGDKAAVRLYTVKGPLAAGVNVPTMVEIQRWVSGEIRCTPR
jgi:hypothetical protein